MPSLQNNELLPEHEVLDDKVPTATEEAYKRSERGRRKD
jgi:hypothetical protein